MSIASRYWLLIRLNATGNRQIEEIAVAKAFFSSTFPEIANIENLSDGAIQHHLWQSWQNNSNINPHPAQLCLRCFISSVIEQVCIQLETNFGNNYGFTRRDLFPLLLNDIIERPYQPPSSYTSVACEILQTFNPERGNLSSWTTKLVKQHRDLKNFLIQHGIYLVTDWAILNDTDSEQLQRIFQEYHHLSENEIKQATILLNSYHSVYRRDRRTARKSGTQGQCLPPTTEQLERIAEQFQSRSHLKFSTSEIMSRLQNIAELLREYRIHIRSGSYKSESLDASIGGSDGNYTLAERIPAPSSNDEEDDRTEFLQSYRQDFVNCLDSSLETVIRHRITLLGRQKTATINQFTTALHLYHCQGQPMGEIALKIGLQAQYQVTRLLKLKQLRTDVRQLMLKKLLPSVLNKAITYNNLSEAKTLERRIEQVLNEQVENLIKEAEAESIVTKNCPLKSLFALRICHLMRKIK